MKRIGNRKGGDHGVASQPIARDGAAESHTNCIKFFYSKDEKCPMRPFQQHLIDCKLHMIGVVAVHLGMVLVRSYSTKPCFKKNLLPFFFFFATLSLHSK